jgi:chromate transporter
MRRSVVEDQKWMTDEQFARDWALCQVCPGINLLGMAVLIGRKVRGRSGIFLALFGLLLPSVTMTLLLTAGFRIAYRSEALQAAVRGAIPATVGLGWLTCVLMGRGVLGASKKRGFPDLVMTSALLLGSGLLFALVTWGARSIQETRLPRPRYDLCALIGLRAPFRAREAVTDSAFVGSGIGRSRLPNSSKAG